VDLDFYLPYVLIATKVLLIIVIVIFFISGLDDLFVDLFYLVQAVKRRIRTPKRAASLTEKQLLQPAEKWVAVMAPAWDESAVIRRMLINNLRTLNYSRYHVFVGTYPNDEATQREVEMVRGLYGNVHRVVCPKDGPTNKADCLNWIFQGIVDFEKRNKINFEIFVLADSEDVMHPLSLRLFNCLIPENDMIQLPVFPLKMSWYRFTAGHYADEFAENHSKDLLVRELLTGNLPSAGVGCAFSKRAMTTAARYANNQLFNIHSLTEDYEFGLRLGRYGFKQVFAKQAIKREITRKSFWTGRIRRKSVAEYIATREYFPARYSQAVRQKARWMLGINLQGWASLGWDKSGWADYALARDRKGIVSHQAIFLGYAVLFVMTLTWLIQHGSAGGYRYPPLIDETTWLWNLLLVDTCFLVLRCAQRAFWVHRIYGWSQALLSVPRLVWGNVINVAATGRALYLFLKSRITGERVAWDKTVHVYPSEEILKSYRRKLGDLLVESRHITINQLDIALELQQRDRRLLGQILLDEGWLREDDLISVLGEQLKLPTRRIDPESIRQDVIEAVPPAIAQRYGVLPLEISEGGRLVLAAGVELKPEDLAAIEKHVGRPVEMCLASRTNLSSASAALYPDGLLAEGTS
jgi:adsorption protein B